MPKLDLPTLKKYCRYSGFNKDSDTVKYFFEVIEEFDETMQANLLFFATGTFKIPLDNFKDK